MAKIFRSSVINAPIDEVWAKIRDFNALPDWHPAFTDSHIENDEPGDKVDSIKNFNLKELINEQFSSYSFNTDRQNLSETRITLPKFLALSFAPLYWP